MSWTWCFSYSLYHVFIDWFCVWAEASREVASAQSRLAEKDRSTYDSEHLAEQRDSQAGKHRWKEAADAAWQKADAERRAESAQAAQQEADQNLRLGQLEVSRLKVTQAEHATPLHSMKCCNLI